MNYQHFTNEQLISELKLSDQKAFEEIYNRYWKACFKYAVLKLVEKSQAEDICHDIFLTLWQRREAVAINNLEAYLIQAVKYRVLRALQSDAKAKFLAEELLQFKSGEANNTEYSIYFNDIYHAWRKGLEQLPTASKQVFLLSRTQNLTNKEIAKMLLITEKGVEYHITKCLKILKIYLKDYLITLFLIGNSFFYFLY
jgi:RNA polymerase sigma-70 factor (family 1)